MIVLGINGFGQNSSACIVRDGELVVFGESERFTRFKGSDQAFPSRATAFCLAHAGIDLDAVDRIAFGWDANKYPWQMARSFAKSYIKNRRLRPPAPSGHDEYAHFSPGWRAVDVLSAYHPAKISTTIAHGLRAAGLKGRIPKIEFVPHHLAHAYSTYFCSDFQRAGILTIDGSGEDTCTQLAIGDGDNIRIIESLPIPNSLGWFYAAVTEYLGFIPDKDEGKVMGLAAYGESRRDSNRWVEPLSEVLKLGGRSYEVNPRYTKLGSFTHGSRFTDEFVSLVTAVDKSAAPVAYGERVEHDGELKNRHLLDTYVDMAWAAQHLIEQAGVGLAKRLVEEHGVENLCLAGGVALNCKMNGEILQHSGCKRIFVQPASSDAGVALGAAQYIAHQAGDDVRHPLDHAYYGPGFTADEIEKDLKNSKVRYRRVDDAPAAGAEFLAQEKLVGWFQGRMEFGPRALGNRSILANPANPDMRDLVNEQVKYRENWRPFCPSLLADAKDQYLENACMAPYMIVAFTMEEAMRKNLPSVVHIDDTIRPQTVTAEANERYHALIGHLGKQTGHPVVLNTSFNVRGEPIVCTPLDALRTFHSTGLDALVIGDFVVDKG